MGEIRIKSNAKLPVKKVKKKHYWWRYILTFLGGIVFTVGAVGGTVAVLGTITPAKDLISMFGGNPEEILGLEYQDDSILNMVMKLSSQKFETLGDINNVTPIVKKTVEETINPLLEDQIHFSFDWDELKIKPFTISNSGRPIEEVDPSETLGDYIGRAIKEGVTLASFVGNADELSPIIKLFLYPTTNGEGEELYFDVEHAYSLADFINGDSNFFNGIIDKVRVGDVIDTTGDAFLSQMKYWKISDFTSEKLMTLKLGPLFTDAQIESNLLLKTIAEKEWTLNDISNFENLKTLKISEIMDVSGASSLVVAIKDFTLNDLMTKNLADVLKIKDVYPDVASGIMYILREKTISSLSDPQTFMTLKVSEALPDVSEGDILYTFKDYTLEELCDITISDIKIRNVFSSSDIENNRLLKALVSANNDVTLGDLSDYETIASLKLGDILDPEEISGNIVLNALINQDTTIGNLSTNINALKMKDVVDISGEPTDSVKYKIITALGEYSFTSVADHFNELKMNDIFEINSDSALVLQALKDVTLQDLPNSLKTLTVGQVLDIEPGSALDKEAIKNTLISDAQAFEAVLKANLTLKDLVDIDDNSPQILIYLKNTVIDDIADKVMAMTLSDMINISDSSPQLLKSLANVTLFGNSENLETYLTNLKFNQVYTIDDCNEGLLKVLWENSNGGDFKITDLSTQISNLNLVDIIGDILYVDPSASKKRFKNTWWLLLTEEGETFTESEKYYELKSGAHYKLDDIDKIVSNMQYHMKNDSMFTLIDAGFITVSSEGLAKLNQTYPLNPFKKLGDLSISEFINYCLSIIG